MSVSRRQFVSSLAFAAQQPRRPNIVLILADDLGYGDLSCHGATDIKTPNIDSLAGDGVRFTLAYANSPECTPTRTALLTGRYPQRVGGLECAIGVGNVGRYDEAAWLQQRGELGLPPSETTMPRTFRDAGYATACIGKWHLGYDEKYSPLRHGFEHYFGILGGNADYFTHREEDGRNVLYENGSPIERKGHTTDLLADEAIAWLRRQSTAKPFFLYLPFTAPHTPIQTPDNPTVRNGDRSAYAKLVEHMDARTGDVLKQLRAMNAAENTIVIFHSDNGADPNGSNAPFRGRKASVFEGGIRSPLFLRWPAAFPAGRDVKPAAMTMDLLPTLCGACGITAPKSDGVDLLRYARGQDDAKSRTLFFRYKRLENRRKAAHAGNLKLVHDNQERFLFDLASDPREQKNLYAERPEDGKKLEAQLAEWETEVRAPRLADYEKRPL